RHNSEWRSDFRGQPKDGRGSSMFTPLQEHIKKSSGPKQESSNRHLHGNPGGEEKQQQVCDFHNDKGHSTDEWERSTKSRKKGSTNQGSWHRMTRQKVTQSFERVSEITFPSLTTSSGTEGPLVIEAEIGRHMIHRIYVDEGGSNQRDAIRERTDETMFNPEEKVRHIRMTTVRHDRKQLNLSAATPLSVSWTLTKVITKYRWQSQTKRKRLSTPAKGQVGKNIGVYVDDLVIKSHTEAEILRDIDETFRTFSNHITSHVTEANAMYSASAKDLDTTDCFLLFQVMAELPINTIKRVTDLLVALHFAQSESEYPVRVRL
ncbi:hypothetical protein Tco_1334522, partial [Tanacetum coccineum]